MTLATLALTVATTPLVALLWLVARARGAALAVFGDAAPLPSLLRGLVEGALAFLVLNILVTAPLVVLFDIPDVQEQLRAVALADGLTPLAALTLVVVTPLGEEVLYRGLLYRGLRNRLATWPAIALSGAVFGVVHVEPLAILVTGLLGAELAWLLERRAQPARAARRPRDVQRDRPRAPGLRLRPA